MSDTLSPKPITQLRAVALMVFRALVGAYALNTILHLLGALVIGESWHVIAFLNTFAHLLWMPALLIAPLCLFLRQWRLLAMTLPAVIAFLFIWGDMLLPPRTLPNDTDGVALRVLSYNLHANNRDVNAYTELIRTANADIVALQEVSDHHVIALESVFATTYPYRAFHPGGTRGQGIMSRYPILNDDYWRYEFLRSALGHQRVELALTDEQRIVVYNVHPSHPGMQGDLFNPDYRSQEIADLRARITRESLPVLWAGDFNMSDFSDDYRAVRAVFRDAFRDGGWGMGWTFPNVTSYSTLLRLDYIFYSRHFRADHAQVMPTLTGSDHRALYADFTYIRGN
ncbi:MAG: endonuclease/exonuclease/phosphatase family protein [Anaerolineae bacterium]